MLPICPVRYKVAVSYKHARGVFVGASLEAGNAWANRSSVTLRDLRLGSSVFLGADTSVGPVYFSLVHAPKGYSGIYVFVGRP